MGHRSPRIATASATAAGTVGLATVLLAGPAEASHPMDPGGSRTAVAAAPALIVVTEVDHGVQIGQVGAGALGGLVVAAAAAVAANRPHHGADESADPAHTA